MKTFFIVLSILIISFFESCDSPGTEDLKDNPTQFKWVSATPESQGMSSEKLDQLVMDLSKRGTKKLLIIKNDRIVCSWFAAGYEDSIRGHYTASLARAIVSGMSLLVAMISKGLNPHMDLPGWKGQFWRQQPDPFITARDSAPVLYTPGTRYSYSNLEIGMLTYAVTASLKGSSYTDIRSYLNEKIYSPVSISENEYSIGY